MKDEKPDGYIAWHPTRQEGFIDLEYLGYQPEESENALVNWYREDCEQAYFDFEEAKADGWRIRPVKLVFLDEVKGE